MKRSIDLGSRRGVEAQVFHVFDDADDLDRDVSANRGGHRKRDPLSERVLRSPVSPHHRFVDHGDGTVTDTCTGLMWQQDTGNNGNAVALGRALVYCENLELAGHDDWRLPNLRELLSIVDHGRFDPSIDPVFGVLSSFYWSSTSYAPTPGQLWTLYFGSGFFTNDGISALNNIRAVRRGP